MATLSTTSTNFSSFVTVAIQQRLEKALRAGLGFTAPGTILPASHVPGTNATFRALSYADVPMSKDIALAEGVWTTSDEDDMPLDFVDFSGAQTGHVIKITDLADFFSEQELGAVASEKIARSALVRFDEIAKGAYAAATSEVFAGTAASDATLVPANVLTGAAVRTAVAMLRSRDVEPAGNGFYVCPASPWLLSDLMNDTTVGGWLDTRKYADTNALIEGEVGQYAGVRFVDVGSRGLKVADQIGPVIAGAGNAIIAATDTFTSTGNHGLVTGNRVRVISITGGAGLAASTTYFAIVTAATTFKFATTLANAKAGTAIDVTTDSSAQSVSSVANIYKAPIIGSEALFMGDFSTLKTYVVNTPDSANPLGQYIKVGYKLFAGAALNKVDATDSGLTDVPRFVTISAATTLGG